MSGQIYKDTWAFVLKHRYVNYVEHEYFFDKLFKDKKKEYFIIEYSEQPIGVCGYSDIDFICDKGEIFIHIPEELARGKGSGKEAVLFLLEYGFVSLSLNKISLRVVDYNGSYMFFENRNIDIILSYQGFTMFFGVLFSWL